MRIHTHDWTAIQREYDAGATQKQVAEKFHLSGWMISSAVRRGWLIPRRYVEPDWSVVQSLYDSGLSASQLAKNLHLSPKTLSAAVKDGKLILRKMMTGEEFVCAAASVHGETYDYSRVHYVDKSVKVEILCPTHGVFRQQPFHHLNGTGCPKCAGRNKTNEEFIAIAYEKHGDRYLYDRLDFVSNARKVIIGCKTHGYFEQLPNNHIHGNGCPKCSKTSSNKESAYLEMMGVPVQYRNVCIRVNKRRFWVDGYIPTTKTIYEFDGDFWHGNPLVYRFDAVNHVLHETFGALYQKTVSRRETLRLAGYNVISIWESEWDYLVSTGFSPSMVA